MAMPMIIADIFHTDTPEQAKSTKRSPYLRAAQFCLELGSTQMVERAMTQELHKNNDSVELQVINTLRKMGMICDENQYYARA